MESSPYLFILPKVPVDTASMAVVRKNFKIEAEPCVQGHDCAHSIVAFMTSFLPAAIKHDWHISVADCVLRDVSCLVQVLLTAVIAAPWSFLEMPLNVL
ncbi:hypothetical protein HPB49_004980 [Dermacentor silvarum]|uniref:Uncharacterized protein n=1 Tax=Dermacentor silvarum TaxID=543639 RepID=A0ACB8CVH0_DERSI|nr:hypothetical protein HPB49_004980 [Dermacentor silvarum]